MSNDETSGQETSGNDSKYRTVVHNLTVSRRANDVGGGTVGAIESITVEATRSEKRDAGTYHRTIVYTVDGGIARVDEVVPTHPDSRTTDHAFRPGHVAVLLNATDSVVHESVPEVESVCTLSSALAEHSEPSTEPSGANLGGEKAEAEVAR